MSPLDVLVLVLLLVSFITAMFHVGYPISLTHLCFTVFLSIRIPVFIVSFLHLDHRLSPQVSNLSKPFPKSILAHSATVLLCNMACIDLFSCTAARVSNKLTYLLTGLFLVTQTA